MNDNDQQSNMKNRRFKTIFYLAAAIAALCVGSNMSFAQAHVKYTRKSISYVNALLATKDFKLPSSQQNYLLDAIHTGIRIARFDYNPLPENTHSAFRKRLSQRNFVSAEDIESLVNTTIVPEIIKILDINKEIRAQSLVSETQRNSFIALKAKEIGITAQQLEQVMNSSYLYIPLIDKCRVKKDSDKEEVSVHISGGLFWYHIIAGEKPHIEKFAKISSEGMSGADSEENYSIDGERVSAEEYAFRNAAHTLAMNLEIQTRELDMFKLRAPITNIQRRKIWFPLGRAEGIKLDDPFFVGEWIEKSNGKIRFQKSGFVRVSTVLDNRSTPGQLSQAIAIKKGDWAKGMMVVEHPRLGIDIAIKPRWFTMNIDEGIVFNGEKGFVIYFDDYQGGAMCFDIDLHWNIASLIKKRQSFLVLGGSAGLVPVKSSVFNFAFWENHWTPFDLIPTENWIAGIYYGHIGYLKKFYLGPFAVHGEGLFGLQTLSIWDYKSGDDYDGETITISNNTVGLRVNLGLEYAVNIDWNIGMFAGFNVFPPTDWWTVKYDEKEVDMENMSGWAAPKIYSIGPTFGFYIHFSPPTLPFNPAAVVQNQLKNL